MNEVALNALMCAMLWGEPEVRHTYEYGYVYADCETSSIVIEAGLDKRSSLDSVQQSLFLSYLTQKTPVVIIYDTDGKIGAYEYRIEKAAKLANVLYIRVGVDEIVKE